MLFCEITPLDGGSTSAPLLEICYLYCRYILLHALKFSFWQRIQVFNANYKIIWNIFCESVHLGLSINYITFIHLWFDFVLVSDTQIIQKEPPPPPLKAITFETSLTYIFSSEATKFERQYAVKIRSNFFKYVATSLSTSPAVWGAVWLFIQHYLISRIRFLDIKNYISWYQEMHFLISRIWFLDIKKCTLRRHFTIY